MLNTFLPSIFTGDLTVVVKAGLSILTTNSYASKNGFLKSIGGGFAFILYGPLGCGGELNPFNVQIYYPPSGEVTIN